MPRYFDEPFTESFISVEIREDFLRDAISLLGRWFGGWY